MGNKTPRAGFPYVQLFLTQRLARLAGANSMRAIREGLLWLVPCLLVSALFLILSALAQMSGQPESVVRVLAGLHAEIGSILPLLVAASIGYMLSIRHRLPRLIQAPEGQAAQRQHAGHTGGKPQATPTTPVGNRRIVGATGQDQGTRRHGQAGIAADADGIGGNAHRCVLSAVWVAGVRLAMRLPLRRVMRRGTPSSTTRSLRIA